MSFCCYEIMDILQCYSGPRPQNLWQFKKGSYKYIFGTLQQIPVNMYVFSYGYLWTGSIYLCLIWSDPILTQVPLLHRWLDSQCILNILTDVSQAG